MPLPESLSHLSINIWSPLAGSMRIKLKRRGTDWSARSVFIVRTKKMRLRADQDRKLLPLLMTQKTH